jgi:hypothetical protein
LERPVGGEPLAGCGQAVGHNGVRVFEHAAAEFGTVRDAHDDGATGQGAVVHADDELLVEREVFSGIHGVSIRLAKASLPGVGVEEIKKV